MNNLFEIRQTKTGKPRKYLYKYIVKIQEQPPFENFRIDEWTPKKISIQKSTSNITWKELVYWQQFFQADDVDVVFDDGYYAYSERTWGHDHVCNLIISNPTRNITVEEWSLNKDWKLVN